MLLNAPESQKDTLATNGSQAGCQQPMAVSCAAAAALKVRLSGSRKTSWLNHVNFPSYQVKKKNLPCRISLVGN